MGDFARRAAAALVLAPIALAAVWSGGLVFAGLVALAAVVMSYEWDRLAGGDQHLQRLTDRLCHGLAALRRSMAMSTRSGVAGVSRRGQILWSATLATASDRA